MKGGKKGCFFEAEEKGIFGDSDCVRSNMQTFRREIKFRIFSFPPHFEGGSWVLCWPISKNSIPSALNPFWRRKRHFMILVPLMSYGGDDDLCFPLIFIAEILLQLRFSLEKKEKSYGMLHSLSFFSAIN